MEQTKEGNSATEDLATERTKEEVSMEGTNSIRLKEAPVEGIKEGVSMEGPNDEASTEDSFALALFVYVRL
jgi:hypothetical protein